LPNTARRTGARAARPKFRPHVTVNEVRGYIALFHRLSSVEPDPDVTTGLTPDPGDDYLVALARAAKAHFLVSGDPHLIEASSTHRCSLQESP
jgi:predicted nucleic acid-binding protein